MNCFTCATREQRTTPATATCSQCGAATCVEHTAVGWATMPDHSPGNPVRHRLPGRRLFCAVCAPSDAVPALEAVAAGTIDDARRAAADPGVG